MNNINQLCLFFLNTGEILKALSITFASKTHKRVHKMTKFLMKCSPAMFHGKLTLTTRYVILN